MFRFFSLLQILRHHKLPVKKMLCHGSQEIHSEMDSSGVPSRH